MSGGMLVKEVAALCKQEKIKGAVKQGETWIIPLDAEKPADSRVNPEHSGKP